MVLCTDTKWLECCDSVRAVDKEKLARRVMSVVDGGQWRPHNEHVSPRVVLQGGTLATDY
jgi:hypothetical protein